MRDAQMFVVAIAIVLLMVAACRLIEVPPTQLPEQFRGNEVTANEAFGTPPALRAAGLVPTDVWPAAAVRRTSLAQVAGGLPVVLFDELPVVGRPWEVTWLTEALRPRSNAPTALIASQRRVDGGPLPNGRGEILQVAPDLIIVPREGTWLTQFSGIVRLEVTWPEWAAGSHWFCQLLLADPRSPSGVMVSPMLEFTIGNRVP